MVATAVVAGALACRSEPGLGSVTLMRGGKVHTVDLATCRNRVVPHGLAPTRPIRGPIAADGLTLRVVSAAGGKPRRLDRMLPYRDYLTWCGGRRWSAAG